MQDFHVYLYLVVESTIPQNVLRQIIEDVNNIRCDVSETIKNKKTDILNESLNVFSFILFMVIINDIYIYTHIVPIL